MLHNVELKSLVSEDGTYLHVNLLPLEDGESVTSDDIRNIIIPFLGEHPMITGVSFAACGLTDACVEAICEMKTITAFDLCVNEVGDKGAVMLAKNACIRQLGLMANQIGPVGAEALASSKSLRVLELSSNPIMDAGAIALADSSSIVSLSVGGNSGIQRDGIAALANNPILESLSMSNADLSEEDMLKLSSSQCIRSLNLCSVELTDNAALAFAKNKILTELYVEVNNISESSKRALLLNRNLHVSSLDYSQVENDPIKVFVEAKAMNLQPDFPTLNSIVMFMMNKVGNKPKPDPEVNEDKNKPKMS